MGISQKTFNFTKTGNQVLINYFVRELTSSVMCNLYLVLIDKD